MKKIVYKSKAIQAVILIIAAAVLLSLWPFRIWQETVTSSISVESGTTMQVDENMTVLQSFVAQYNHMDSMRLYLGEATEGESFTVRILNEGQVMIAEEEIAIEAANLPGYVDVLVDADMEVGKMYHCIVEASDASVSLGCETILMTDQPNAGALYYDNQPVEGKNLVADYNYSVPLRKGKVLLFGGIAVLLATLCITLVRKLYKNDKLITVERAFKFTLNPLVAILTVVGIVCILTGTFGSYVLDNTVFLISILLLGGILFYGINHNRDGQKPIFTSEYLGAHLPDLFQSVCIAGALVACCEYMNGLYDIHHAMAERKEMIWFALAVIAMFKWKEIVNLYNLLYVVAAGIGGYFYYQNSVLKLAEQTIKETEIDWHLQIIRNTVIIAILLGLIVIRTIIGLCKKKLSKADIFYSGLLLVFFAAIIIFRNGRWWTVTLAVAFTLFYLTYGMWDKKTNLLVNICRGIVLHFGYVVGYSLLHRPYVTYKTARYPMIFHTVTMTAYYLTLVECAVIVLLLMKFAKSQKLKDIWKELVLFGVVSSYMIFTMARTGFLALAVTLVFALIILAAGKGKEKLLNMLKAVGLMILATVICLPVTFTAQRTIPALASDPILFEIESYPDDVMRGRKLDSMQFMRVGRFIDVFGEKIFNLPEGTFDVYGEIAEYRRTHDITGADIDPSDTETITMEDVFTGKVTLEEAQEAVLKARKEKLDAEAAQEAEAAELQAEETDSTELQAEESGETDSAETQVEDTEVTESEDLSVLMTSGEREALEGVYESEDMLPEGDYTNGRTDIYKAYIEQLNMTGHAEMGALLPNGEIATHAHNIYLQVAYDHGIPIGLLFLLFGFVSWIKAMLYYNRNKEKISCAALPLVVITAVAVAGMVEWLFHLSNPCGLILMLVITPLVYCKEQQTNEQTH